MAPNVASKAGGYPGNGSYSCFHAAMEDEEAPLDASPDEREEAVEEEAQLLELGPCTSPRDLVGRYSSGCQAHRRQMLSTLGTPPAPADHPP